ncbi:hypothetical protein EI427_02370 [Flammeovirga pectinis]|uniref:Uncharacterized protein n=1 Tax=Flammeovirga pectinis TaxID=2494373 RepID=A0A3S9NYT0_9BACT|nr:hypothetical protein [Flammeovirga pectinis]AZQ61101.1 hypothetical protein EI427_02370 [Flammeovirga pectinis]
MTNFYKIALEGELKNSDIFFSVFLKVTKKNNLFKFSIDAKGEFLSLTERESLLNIGMSQYAETRIFETFLKFREEGISADISDYISVLSDELSVEDIHDTLVELSIISEGAFMKSAS